LRFGVLKDSNLLTLLHCLSLSNFAVQSERIQLQHEKEVQLGLHLLRFSEVSLQPGIAKEPQMRCEAVRFLLGGTA
jgi:hypothetical protein